MKNIRNFILSSHVSLHTYFLFSHNPGSKHHYNILNKSVIDMNCKIAWNVEININIDEITWHQTFRTCLKLIRDHNIMWFQYQILHCILDIQKIHTKIGQASSPDCSFCKSSPKTTFLFFLMSRCVSCLQKVFKYGNKRELSLNLDPIEYILGYLNIDTKSLQSPNPKTDKQLQVPFY